MAKFTPQDLNSGFMSTDALNENFTALETLSDTWLSRDGSAPNAMLDVLDMNNNRIINLGKAVSPGDAVSIGDVIDIIDDLAGGGDGGGGTFYYSTDFVTLTAGQTQVVFDTALTLSNFALSGLDTDNGKIFEGVDFDINHASNTVDLYESYPAGTVISRYREGSDTSLTPEDAAESAIAAEHWAVFPTDELVPLTSGGNQIDEYSSRHFATKAEESAVEARSDGIGAYPTATGALVLDALDGSVSVFEITLTGVVTDVSVINVPSEAGRAYECTLVITSDGASTVAFGSQFVFVAATPPTLTLDSGKRDWLVATTLDNGTSFDTVLTIAAIG